MASENEPNDITFQAPDIPEQRTSASSDPDLGSVESQAPPGESGSLADSAQAVAAEPEAPIKEREPLAEPPEPPAAEPEALAGDPEPLAESPKPPAAEHKSPAEEPEKMAELPESPVAEAEAPASELERVAGGEEPAPNRELSESAPAASAASPRKRSSRRPTAAGPAPAGSTDAESPGDGPGVVEAADGAAAPALTEADGKTSVESTKGKADKDKINKGKSNKAHKADKSTPRAGKSKSSRERKSALADPSVSDQTSLQAKPDKLPNPSTDQPRAHVGQIVDEDALRFDGRDLPFWQSEPDDALASKPENATTAADSPPTRYGPLFQAPVAGYGRSLLTGSESELAEEEQAALGEAPQAFSGDRGIRTGGEEATGVLAADPAETEEGAEEPADAEAETPRRRRRRGGKGRRSRSASLAATSDEATGTDEGQRPDEALEPDVALAEDPHDEAEAPTTRRRTRRRRRSASAADSDTDIAQTDAGEAPRVTTKVRESRRDEVTALKGSTRLEAKKQRRREGREAGRRRTIITEAEFLARRESVERVMVVRHLGDRTQIGVLEDGVLVEHYISRETTVSMAGNIYLGRVQNVLPSMEAAFVDIGKGRNAVLYAGEVNWDAAGLESSEPKRIENALTSGESVLVQVTKDPIGHKGARLTSQISLPGRYLVYVPNNSMTGISRKLPDTERTRLKKILKEVVPDTAGVIVRTAAEGASEEELRADVERLTKTWADIVAKAEGASTTGKRKNKGAGAPLLLHGEPDLTVRVIRDIFNEDFTSLVVAGEEAWREVSEYVTSVAPDLAERVSRWTSDEDLFSHYRVDEQIAKAMDRKVWLPSGGSLVIDRTEAMTVVDVNTGKFIGSGGNLEETVTKNNLEAAEEIVRQLRLRDVGGIIVIDFIDMVLESNRDLVVRRLLECLGRDRTKHQVAEVTSLGLVQMTRKRVGSGLIEVFSEVCEACGGRGILIHSDPVDRSGNGQEQTEPAGYARKRSRNGEPVSLPRPSGPTPAQIAAAAHAAALKTAASADGAEIAPDADAEVVGAAALSLASVEQDGPVEQVASIQQNELLDQAATDQRAAAQDRPDELVAEVEADAVTDGIASPAEDEETPASDGPTTTDDEPSTQVEPEESEPELPAYGAPLPLPATQPRRRRGRVVAPAGPPRSTVHGQPVDGPTS